MFGKIVEGRLLVWLVFQKKKNLHCLQLANLLWNLMGCKITIWKCTYCQEFILNKSCRNDSCWTWVFFSKTLSHACVVRNFSSTTCRFVIKIRGVLNYYIEFDVHTLMILGLNIFFRNDDRWNWANFKPGLMRCPQLFLKDLQDCFETQWNLDYHTESRILSWFYVNLIYMILFQVCSFWNSVSYRIHLSWTVYF